MRRAISVLSALLLISVLPLESSAQTVTTITAEFNAAGDLEVGPDGNVYVADFGPSLNGGGNGANVYRVTPAGEVVLFATGLVGASGNAFDSKGNLYQSNIGANRISKISPDGIVSTFTTGPGIFGPVGVAVDTSGNVFNTNCGSNTITKTTPGGATTVFAINGLLSCPNGLTIDPDGNLYTSNFNNCNVLKIDHAGVVKRVGCASTFGAPNIGNGHITYANNRLYVAGWRSGVIFEMPLDGSPVSVLAGAGGSGREDGPASFAKFHQPNGIDASPSGDTLYVNDTVNLGSGGILLHPNVVRMITGVLSTITAAEVERPEKSGISISEMYPNPAGGLVNAEYVLDDLERIRLEIVDLLGRRSRVVDEGLRAAGRHRVAIDVSGFSPGAYLMRLTSGSSVSVRSILVAR